jgi:hypothetical protein
MIDRDDQAPTLKFDSVFPLEISRVKVNNNSNILLYTTTITMSTALLQNVDQ